MAWLDKIAQTAFEIQFDAHGSAAYIATGKRLQKLPQIFWQSGDGWDEANRWFYDRQINEEVKFETVERQAKFLVTYANFLEDIRRDWRHFPYIKKEQVLRRYRKYLIEQRNAGHIAGSTASAAMAVAVQFYRYAAFNQFFHPANPMWRERTVHFTNVNTAGFSYHMVRTTTDLLIPNRKIHGIRLEEGLLPISAEDQTALWRYTADSESTEAHLMLSCGFLSGARVGTVATITRSSIDTARRDPETHGMFLLRVGPGTPIKTKFDVAGEIWLPEPLLNDLKEYSKSDKRTLRASKAAKTDKDVLFLTKDGGRYTPDSIGKLVRDLRKRAVAAGLKGIEGFYFHQSRATFGTNVMKIFLDCGVPPSTAIKRLRDAMLHKDEKTTWVYIRFLESLKGKQAVSAEFNKAFTGIRHRDWTKFRDE